jgi:hypothetical protein
MDEGNTIEAEGSLRSEAGGPRDQLPAAALDAAVIRASI